jgi:hypothetical protein
MDLVFVGAVLVLTWLTLGFARLCDRLMEKRGEPR